MKRVRPKVFKPVSKSKANLLLDEPSLDENKQEESGAQAEVILEREPVEESGEAKQEESDIPVGEESVEESGEAKQEENDASVKEEDEEESAGENDASQENRDLLADTIDTSATATDVREIGLIEPAKRKRFDRIDVLHILLLLLSIGLWMVSLQHVSVQGMNDFGLISVLSPRIIVALGILVVNFVFALQRREFKPFLLALHIVFLILVLNGTPNLIEEAPRFAVVYTHAGYTEYIMRTGTVNTNLDAYFSWPVFFVLSAFLTKVFGYSTILSYAGWAPVFLSLLYFGALYMLFASITTNKRLVWLSILFFYLTNWIGQEYFSPQGMNFFLYLVVIAMLLKWFKIPRKSDECLQPGEQGWQDLSFKQKFTMWLKAPEPTSTTLRPWQQAGLLCCVILIFGFIVSSHQLTPFFVLVSVSALVIFRHTYPFWLPILMGIMLAAWLFFMAGGFLSGHSDMVIGSLGNFFGNLSTSTTGRASVGDPQHLIVAQLRILMTAMIWLMAFLGCIKRVWQGYRDITAILLATAGFILIVSQNYGGEMFLRIYLFTLPFMVFFVASLFYSQSLVSRSAKSLQAQHSLRMRMPMIGANLKSVVARRVNFLQIPQFSQTQRSGRVTTALIIINLVLLSGLFFTRYGNERVDYMTYAEWNGVQYLYQIAPAHSLLIQVTDSVPIQFENYEKYNIHSLLGESTALSMAVFYTNSTPIVQFIRNIDASRAYIIFTRGQEAEYTAYDGAPNHALAKLETALLASKEFRLVYNNPDAQILLFTGQTQGGVS